MLKKIFPIGARVYVDGRDLAIVKEAFPDGSSSYAFPHYRVDVIAGDKNMAVSMSRVGVDLKKERA
jgi:3D (Asp-Asp-Asp) domain-containing protein